MDFRSVTDAMRMTIRSYVPIGSLVWGSWCTMLQGRGAGLCCGCRGLQGDTVPRGSSGIAGGNFQASLEGTLSNKTKICHA